MIYKFQNGGKTYKHNDYYGYINKIQEKAISNPQWFWSDAEDASQARQWLYDNGASAVVDNIYENTPENIQKNISYKKLSNASGTKKMTSDIHSAQKNFMDTAGAVGLQSMAPVGLAVGLTVAPEVTIPALIGGAGGMKATDYAINKLSNDKYNTWGEFIRGDKDLGQTGNLLAEFTNPGGWIGGGMTGALVRRSTPMMIRSMQDRVYELNRDGKFIYDIPGGSKARLNATEPVKWKPGKSKDAAYNDGTIQVPLFARKSQIAHELGHHAAGQGDQILSAYTEGYQYAPNSSWETERAENFADLFKTKLGYKYKGKKANLKSRQDAIDSGESKVFDHLSNPGNHRETAYDRFSEIDNPESTAYGIERYLRNITPDWITGNGGPVQIIESDSKLIPEYYITHDKSFYPVDPYFPDIARELTKEFSKKVDFSDLSSIENIRKIQDVIKEHPFMKEFGNVVTSEGEPILPLPFDLPHMFWKNTSGKSGAQSIRNLINNGKKLRVTEINTSGDAEPIKAFVGDLYNGTEPGKVSVIPAKTFKGTDLIQSRGKGNTMHNNVLRYRDGRFSWGGLKEHKGFTAPLREDTYADAILRYSDDILSRWNKHIDNINEKQGLKLRHSTITPFPSFDTFEYLRQASPNIERDDFFLQFHKKGGKFKNLLHK